MQVQFHKGLHVYCIDPFYDRGITFKFSAILFLKDGVP